MRYPAAEKLEIIRLVEQSHLQTFTDGEPFTPLYQKLHDHAAALSRVLQTQRMLES
jgi:hypothetical protein